MDSDLSPEQGSCLVCGSVTTGVVHGGYRFAPPKYCSIGCLQKHEPAQREEADPSLPVPALYRDTDPKLLPANLASIAERWSPKYDKGNLIIHGPTRQGKTRTAWLICQRMAKTYKVVTLTMREIEYGLQEGFQKGNWHRVVDGWCKAQFLFIDDLGKEKLTERTQSCLFQIIDDRATNMLPTLITTNYTSKTLKDKFPDEETALALLARIKEFYDTPVSFKE